MARNAPQPWSGSRDASDPGGLEEGRHRRVVLAAGLNLDPTGNVDGIWMGDLNCRGDVLRAQPAGHDRRHFRAVLAQQAPVEALAAAAPEAFSAPVEEVEIGPVGLRPMDVGSAGDVDRLDPLAPRSPRPLGAEGGALFPVQLHHRQAGVLNRLRNLVQLGVDEYPDDPALAPEGRPDPHALARLECARACVVVGRPDPPRPEPHPLAGVIEIRDPANLASHTPQGTGAS